MNIEKLRELCLSFPEAIEDVKWDSDLAFSIGGKMFCVTSVDVESGASFKVLEAEFRAFCLREGVIPAPYLARHQWVYVLDFNWLSDAEWEHFLRQSYDLVREKLPKKLPKK